MRQPVMSFARIEVSCSGDEWHGRMHIEESNQKLKLQKQRHSVQILPEQRHCVSCGWGKKKRDESNREEGVRDQRHLFKGQQSYVKCARKMSHPGHHARAEPLSLFGFYQSIPTNFSP